MNDACGDPSPYRTLSRITLKTMSASFSFREGYTYDSQSHPSWIAGQIGYHANCSLVEIVISR